MGIWQSEGERKREKEKQGGKGEREGGEKTERLWMERMESLESVGPCLILVARQPMSNRVERDGWQEKDHTR